MTDAIVAFGDNSDHWLSWFLKKGYRHVFCAVLDELGCWILVDAREGVPVFRYITIAKACDLATFWREEGYVVIETEQVTKPLRSPFVTVNCVGLVKAALCIRAPFAVTPWLLYRHLERRLRKDPS